MKAEMCQFDAWAVVDAEGNVIMRRHRGQRGDGKNEDGPAFFFRLAWAERWLKTPRDIVTVEEMIDGEIVEVEKEYLHTNAVAVVQVQVTITAADLPQVQV